MDGSKWTSSGTVSVSGGEAVIGSTSNTGYIYSSYTSSEAIMRTNVKWTSRDATYVWWGWITAGGSSQPYAIFDSAGTSSQYGYFNDGANSYNTAAISLDDNYHLYDIKRYSTGAEFIYDDVSEGSTGYNYAASQPINIRDNDSQGTVYADWIFLRQYVSTEPTWGSWGSESSGSTWSISNSGTLTFNNLTISETPLSQSNFSATVNGTLTVNSDKTLAPTGGTITMTGTSKSIYNYGTSTFYNLTINDSASIDSYGSFTTTGNLTINSSGSLEVFGRTSLTPVPRETLTQGQMANILTPSSTTLSTQNTWLQAMSTIIFYLLLVQGKMTLLSGNQPT